MAEVETPRDRTDADAIPHARRILSRRFVTISLLLLVVAFIGAFAYGWVTSPEPSAVVVLPSSEQEEALGRYGRPMAFWLTDDPGTPGEDEFVRIEQWFYPADGTILTFVDGHLTGTLAITFTESFAGSPISPTELDRTMSEADVSALLGEPAVPATADSAGYPGYSAYTYPESRIAVGYSDGMLLTAQSY